MVSVRFAAEGAALLSGGKEDGAVKMWALQRADTSPPEWRAECIATLPHGLYGGEALATQ